MRRYRQLWFVVAVTLGAVGLVGVLLGRPASVSVATVIAGGAVSWLGWRSFCRRFEQSVGPAVGAGAGALGAVAALSLVGLSVLLGPNAVLVGLLVLAAAPPVLAWVAGEIRSRHPWAGRRADDQPPTSRPTSTARPTMPVRPTPPVPPVAAAAPDAAKQARPVPVPLPPLPPTVPLRDVSDAELCWAWRTSFTTLQRHHITADLGRRAQLVHLRQQYLDELERRNPAGFRRWLYYGARPASDPSRYIAPPPARTGPVRAARVEPTDR